jgi:secreted PhoX family phosphatase
VTTLAGNGNAGPIDGSGGPSGSASFNHPTGLALDAAGNVYVADSFSNLIRKIDASGKVTTLAGTGDAGFLNGKVGDAGTTELNQPSALALDDAGIIDIADTSNNRIRRLDGGTLTTVSGNGFFGFVNDAGVAEYAEPDGIAIDGAGNIYVADQFNNCVREIGAGGAVSTFAGIIDGGPGFVDGAALTGQLAQPSALAFDTTGNLWVADTGNNSLRRIDSQGNLTTVAGNGDAGDMDGTGGPSGSAALDAPMGVALDVQGDVYVADTGNNQVRKVDAAGNVTTLAGSGLAAFADGPASVAAFSFPTGLAVDASGRVYVGDSNNNRIRVISCPASQQ